MSDARPLAAAPGEAGRLKPAYGSLLEAIPAIVYVRACDEGDRPVYVSPQIEEILGYTPEEWLADGGSLRILHPDDAERVLAEERRALSSGEPFGAEYRLVARDGRVVRCRDRAVIAAGAPGQPRFRQGVIVPLDAVAPGDARAETAPSADEPGPGPAVEDSKYAFLTAMHHELRTPLTTVVGIASVFEEAPERIGDETAGELASMLATNARKLNTMFMDMLDLDRLARGVMKPKPEETDLAELVDHVVAESGLLDERPVEVVVDVAAAGGIVIAVEDEGPEVPPEMRDAIFEPFRGGPETTEHAPGMAVGLALVLRFAELQSGRAWVEPREGGGESFRVFLPDRRETRD